MTVRRIDLADLRELAVTGCTVKEMSEQFQCTPQTVRKWLRRYGLFHQWSELRCKQHVCEYCEKPTADRFCSKECWGYANRVDIEAAALSSYVEKGTPLLRMSAELNLDRNRVRAALIRNGQFHDWAKRRYKKCAFQKAGPTSATIASVAVTTPLSRSVARSVGDTNYGS